MGAKRGPASDLSVVVGWLALLWAAFAIDVALRAYAGIWIAEWLGLRPGRVDGLAGIVTAHLLHATPAHLIANSVGLLVLGWLACKTSRRLAALAVLYSALCAGVFTWCSGLVQRIDAVHIGASGIAFGLLGFLLANALFRRGILPVLLGVLVFLLFAGSLVAMFPPADGGNVQAVSWQMHLGGFIGGVIASWQLRRTRAG
jgi:membrane associated rhomboid family serine protease